MREMKDSGVEWIGAIPASWQTLTVGSLFKVRNEKVNDTDYLPLSVTKGGIVPQMENVAKSDANDNRKMVLANDFVINSRSDRKQSCGVSALDGSVSLINTVLYPSKGVPIVPEYLNYLLKNYGFAEEFYRWGHGIVADLWTTRWQEMKSILLPIPSMEEQQQILDAISAQTEKVDILIANVQTQIEKLKAYKQSLITEVVTKGLDPTVPMKKSGVEWLGEVPAHWGIYRIANLYAERSESGLPELPILTVSINTGVSDHEIADKDKDRVFIRMEDRSKYKRVCPGDLTYNMMRAWQGAFGAVRVDGLVSPAYVVAKPKNDIPLDSRYIEALLRTPVAIEEMHRYSRGIVDFRLRLYWPEFKNICICLPLIEEQHKIADYIDEIAAKVDALVAIKQAKIEKLEQYKRSLIYEYVTGKKEVTA